MKTTCKSVTPASCCEGTQYLSSTKRSLYPSTHPYPIRFLPKVSRRSIGALSKKVVKRDRGGGRFANRRECVGDCPQALRERSYGRNRARKRARWRYSQSFPGNKFHWDILRAIVRFAGEIASWQFRRRLEFSDKMVRNSTTNARATVEWPSSLASRCQGGPTVSAVNSGCQEKIF